MLDLTMDEMMAFRNEAMPLLEKLRETVCRYVGDDTGVYATMSDNLLTLGSFETHWTIEDTADMYTLSRGHGDHNTGYKSLDCLRELHKDSNVA